MLVRLTLLLLLAAGPVLAQPADNRAILPDSLEIHRLEPVQVTADPLRLPVDAGPVHLDALRIRDAGGASLADLGSLLPSTQITVNSRGEGLFMLRGAPERHLPVFLEGIPLVLPWDERADLSMLGTLALRNLEARRGVESALQGQGALAGRVDLSVLRPSLDGPGARVDLRLGEAGGLQLSMSRLGVSGAWEWLAAINHRQRNAWNLPSNYVSEFNQGSGIARNNSDLVQTALLLNARRERVGGGHYSLLLHAMDGSKGVPPETHLADARFWRLPIHRRLLIGARRVAEGFLWRHETAVSLDLFGQNIRPYENADYATGPPDSGQDYEQDRDFTAFVSWRSDRKLGGGRSAGFLASARYARHKESLIWRGPWNASSQLLFSLSSEIRGGREEGWRYRGGLGYEHSSAPETGEANNREALAAAVIHAGLSRNLGKSAELKVAASRRSRFPSMRETFSSALGKFQANPELGPEVQNLIEAGFSMQGDKTEAWLGLFASFLEGGIEKIPYVDGPAKYIRVNRDEVRVMGLEFMLGWRPRPGLHLGLQHSHYRARVREDGAPETAAEDHPDFLSRISLAWTRPKGLRLRLESALTGPRYSSHPDEALLRLPAEGSASLRIGRIFRLERWAPGSDLEMYLRVDNLFDTILLSQIGLPGQGRSVQAGFNLALRG
jgi:iron complex outermembrane recepter protein